MTKLNNHSYQYPKEDQEIIAKLSDPNYEVGDCILPNDASLEDRFKYEICQTILHYQQEHKIVYEKLVQQLDLPFAKAMQILKGRINNFTLKELEDYLKRLLGSYQAKIILAKKEKQITAIKSNNYW